KGTPVRYISQDYALNVTFQSATAYWLASKFAEPEMMRALLESGADPKRAIKDGTTPLMAIMNGSGGNNIVGTTSDPRERVLTPNELAARDQEAEARTMMEAFRIALEQDADVNAANQAGDTVLHIAASRGYVDAVRLLVEHGADVNAVNQTGTTPLHNAASQGSASIIEILVDKGARLDVKNKRGQTPLAMTMVQAGSAGSFVPDEARKNAAEMLRKLGATE